MRYLSVCSGIEAATVAWEPLGFEAIAYSEIEKFPSAVLAHRYPETPNLGDMTLYKEWNFDAPPDILVGGTPCQSFSVAGLRRGMDDPRGNLALVYLGIADRFRPRWVVWENVPGVLSSKGGADFGSFLGALGELGYGWAYRILDAQYCGVPQRRRRVFVVGYLGDWRRAASVLFEPQSLRRDSPPRRETRQSFTHDVAGCLGASGRGFERSGDPRWQDAVVGYVPEIVSQAMSSKWSKGSSGPSGDEVANLVVTHSLRADGFDANEDGTGRGTPIIPIDMRQASRGATMTNNRVNGVSGGAPGTGIGQAGDPSPTIASSHVPAVAYRVTPNNGAYATGDRTDALTTGTDRSATVLAFSSKDHGADAGATSHTLRAMNHTGSHANAGGQVAVAFESRFARNGRGAPSDIVPPLKAQSGETGKGDASPLIAGPRAGVRRLTPRECERLQGFPDDYTLIDFRGKPAADGPRYKALGNSMAVPVMRWIGARIGWNELVVGDLRLAA